MVIAKQINKPIPPADAAIIMSIGRSSEDSSSLPPDCCTIFASEKM